MPASERVQPRIFFGLVCLVVFVVTLSVGRSWWYHNFRSLSSQSALDQGMSQREVVDKLGQPHRIDTHNAWLYRVSGCSDLFCVEFDNEGIVTYAGF